MAIVIVTGSLTPYTSRAYDAFAERCGEELHVYTCARIEPHRAWEIPPPRHFQHTLLPGLRWHRDYTSHLYANPGVLPRLMRLKPELIAVAAFSPTMALATAYARSTGTPYGIATDGTLDTDPGASSAPHRIMRRSMVPPARFGICASPASVALLERWGLQPGRGVVVPIVPSWEAPDRIPAFHERPFDVIIAGGLNDQFKGVLFFAEVMADLARSGRRLRIRVTGRGPDGVAMHERLIAAGHDVQMDGALQPGAMAEALGSAKVLMFPSRQDAWGLVANEAVLCGTPVIGSPHAASSEHFVARFGVGLVRPLVVADWREAFLAMTASEAAWAPFMTKRREALVACNLDAAVSGLQRAFDLGRGSARPQVRPAA
jgi:glycosyltransferase involved in cell wall biosynthesis